MEPLTIVTISNDRFAVHLATTMLFSLFENKEVDTRYRIYIIDGDISCQNKEQLNELLKRYYVSPIYLNVDKNLYVNCPAWGKTRDCSTICWGRWRIPLTLRGSSATGL